MKINFVGLSLAGKSRLCAYLVFLPWGLDGEQMGPGQDGFCRQSRGGIDARKMNDSRVQNSV